jgi:hypothetical protein
MSLTLILVLIGSLTFFGYVIFLVSTSKPKVGNDSEIEKDLDVINKMKEIQIIKETKELQTITAKNELFARAFKNRYGKEIDSENNNSVVDDNSIDEYNENLIGAARTIVTEKNDIYNSNPITSIVENEITIPEEEIIPDFDQDIINELRNEAAFIKNKKEEIIQEEELVQEKETENKKDEQTVPIRNIEDDYTEEELFVLNSTYKTMQKFYH